MGEQGWRSCTDPYQMLAFLGDRVSDRKQWLLACACCRGIAGFLASDEGRHCLEVVERFADGGATDEELAVIHAAVLRAAASRVPYDPTEDYYHAPNAAVWEAAWTAGLVGLCLQTGRPIPPELREVWSWFARGHWPFGYAWLRDECGPRFVY
jgi:hypothetical protein